MAGGFSIEVLGTKQTKRFLRNKEDNVIKQVNKGIANASIFLQGEVKESIAGRRAEHISVDTGRFLNSVDFKLGKFNSTIFSKLPYAPFLEFGNKGFRGRRHFENSKNRNRAKVVQIVDNAVKKI